MRNRLTLALVSLLATAGLAFSTVPAQAAPPLPKPIPGPATIVPPTPDLIAPPASQKAVKAPKGNPDAPAVNSLTSCVGQPNGACFKYSEQGQALSAPDESDGASISFSVHKTFLSLDEQDFHTLTELSIQGSDPGDVVEIGYNIDRTVNGGDDQPNIFIASWTDNVFNAYNGGNGWANASTCAAQQVCPGQSLAAAVGTTKAFSWQHIGSAWWALYDGKFVGAFPDSSWGGSFTKARTVRIFGEIAANHSETCTDMGSGAQAGAGASATASAYALIGSTATASLVTGTVTEPTFWGQTTVSSTSFRLGGKGYNSVNVPAGAAGSQGSCAPATPGTPAASSFQGWNEVCPDNQLVTGCNPSWSFLVGSATIGTCVVIPNPGVTITNGVHNNAGVSGRTVAAYRSGGCTGSAKIYGNQGKEAFAAGSGWEGTAIRAYKRTA